MIDRSMMTDELTAVRLQAHTEAVEAELNELQAHTEAVEAELNELDDLELLEEYEDIFCTYQYTPASYDKLVERFKEEIEPLVVNRYGADDSIALREAFNEWTDTLCKDGLISGDFYHLMDNPY